MQTVTLWIEVLKIPYLQNLELKSTESNHFQQAATLA